MGEYRNQLNNQNKYKMKTVIGISRTMMPKAFSMNVFSVINGVVTSQFTIGITEAQYNELKGDKLEVVSSIGNYQVNLTK